MTETTTTPTTQGHAAAERYVEFWNAPAGDEQRRAAAAAFADSVESHVPVGPLRGVEELIGFRSQFEQRNPDYRFEPRTEPDAHHDRARVQWELFVGGESFATGTDVLELDDAGRIVSITGFLDRAPGGFDAGAQH